MVAARLGATQCLCTEKDDPLTQDILRQNLLVNQALIPSGPCEPCILNWGDDKAVHRLLLGDSCVIDHPSSSSSTTADTGANALTILRTKERTQTRAVDFILGADILYSTEGKFVSFL